MGLKHLLPKVGDFNADILCLQECEELPSDDFEGFEFHWVGKNKNKGLGILTKGSSEFLEYVYQPNFIYFSPVALGNLLVIGVWAFNGRAKKFSNESSGYFLDALDHYKDTILSFQKVLVLGDFNNGPQWDKPNHRNNFSDINVAFNEMGLESLYHKMTGEEFGKEKMATYFHHKNHQKPFHIDYIYSNLDTCKSVSLGNSSEWLNFSDHIPLTADFL